MENRTRIFEVKVADLEEKMSALLTLSYSTHELVQAVAKSSEQNFAKANVRLDGVEKALNNLSKETSSNFNSVKNRLSSIEGELKKINYTSGYQERYDNMKRVGKV